MNDEFYDENIKKIGVCDECQEDVYHHDDMYIDNEGNLFCSLECALNFYGIHKPEDDILC